MSLNHHQNLPLDNIEQSPGCDPKAAKRNSGLFSFLKWFKPSSSRESIDTDVQTNNSSSCESLNSIHSTGTVASFSYVPVSAYNSNNRVSEKCIVLGPETDTYKARLKQRDKRRENDKNLTLRKKYNLFFHRDTTSSSMKSLKKNKNNNNVEDIDDIIIEEDNTKSLPLMTRTAMEPHDQEKHHRRTNSESSKMKRAGAYLHVKGKRRAPQPPASHHNNNTSTMSLRRKKRLAPLAPPDKIIATLDEIYADSEIVYADDVIFNDSLKLDHGILKPAKDLNNATTSRSSYIEAPVSPRPWYKRNSSSSTTNSRSDHKYEPIERRLPDVQFTRNSTIDLTVNHASSSSIDDNTNKSTPLEITNNYKKKVEDKRKSGLSFLTNISELDREATEIIQKKEHQKNDVELQEMPHFMRPKDEAVSASPVSKAINSNNNDTIGGVSPKRRSARDLIAKFNAITNVTKVTMNSAFFGVAPKENSKRDYFGKQLSLNEERKQESLLETHKKKIQQIDKKSKNADQKFYGTPLMKSESASAMIKTKKPETPKIDRKSWYCPKCSISNDYWRIICHVCSTIKPYFDDLTSSPPKTPVKEVDLLLPSQIKDDLSKTYGDNNNKVLERSKTQIGFSALASYNANIKNKKIDKSISMDEKSQRESDNKKEEREKLKKMLIEMKNSLPKRKSNLLVKQQQHQLNQQRASIIVENPETITMIENETKHKEKSSLPSLEETTIPEKTQEEKIVEILVGTTETIYENIKVKKTDQATKPMKVSASAQTSSVLKQSIATTTTPKIDLFRPDAANDNNNKAPTNFEPMKPTDFENIYGDPNGQSPARIYANLAQNDELSLFFNMPKRFNEIKQMTQYAPNNTDTIEVNRLLRRLESSIAKGELTEASIYAKELAQLKINCSVVRQKPDGLVTKKQGFTIEMFVEDKISHRGPFPIEVTENQTVAELKLQVQKEFEIPANVQRWILGNELASDDKTTLKSHKVTEGCPVFLYLVAADAKSSNIKASVKISDVSASTAAAAVITKNNKPSSVADFVVVPSTSKTTTTNYELPKQQNHEIITPKKEILQINVELTKKEEKIDDHIPKIIKVIKKTDATENKPTTNNVLDQQKDNTKVVNNNNKALLVEEDFEHYDSATLKPQAKEWECHLCTLLNSLNSNVCAVCSTVRPTTASSTPKKSNKTKRAPQPHPPKDQTYMQLVNLDNADLVECTDTFECVVCFMEVRPGDGVTLRECLHQFCKLCLAHTIEYTDDAEVKCPYRDDQYSCNIALQDREIKALVLPAVYEQHLAKSMAQAENKIGKKSFHCKTPDCKGWCIFEDNVNEFRCPVCRKTNCLTCQAIHVGVNCRQYQERMNQESAVDDNAKRTKVMLDEMVSKGEALTCPTCQVILMKKWGCDWLRCSMCKTEICWVTRGPRWGPAGKGDITGGCQCGVNGVKCHPQCNYCH